jgi:hypothetical protein
MCLLPEAPHKFFWTFLADLLHSFSGITPKIGKGGGLPLPPFSFFPSHPKPGDKLDCRLLESITYELQFS